MEEITDIVERITRNEWRSWNRTQRDTADISTMYGEQRRKHFLLRGLDEMRYHAQGIPMKYLRDKTKGDCWFYFT